MGRSQGCHLVIGSTGSGKTTFEIEYTIILLNANPLKRALFLITDNGEEKLWKVPEITVDELQTFRGVKKMIVDDQEIFDEITDTYSNENNKFNGIMISDDLGSILSARPKPVLDMMRKRRQCNLEMMWCFHGLDCQTPKGFFGWINNIYLFQTSDAHEDFVTKIRKDKREYFIEMYDKVQRESQTYQHYMEEIIINPIKIYA